jgi:hypothetical protein
MGEIILATVLMELGEAVIQELQRHLGGLLALKEMLVELLTIDDIDGAGLVCTDGDGSSIAVETVGIAAHQVASSYGLDRALATFVISDKVMETAALNVTKETGSGSLGLKDVAMREVQSPTMVQTVVAQIGQGLRIMFFLFHTLMFLQFFAYKITKKGVKNNSAKPENRSPRVQL